MQVTHYAGSSLTRRLSKFLISCFLAIARGELRWSYIFLFGLSLIKVQTELQLQFFLTGTNINSKFTEVDTNYIKSVA